MDPLVTQRQFMLGYCVTKYIHVFHGWVFGAITRRMFFGSVEKSAQIDCVFETREDAEYFLKTVKVENRVDFLREGSHGLNEYRVIRQIDGFHTNIDLRIHAMHSGLSRRKRIPRNIVEPCFDLDYFFWRSDGLGETLPLFCRKPDFGLEECSWLAYAIERVRAKRFCVANGLCVRSPSAMLQTLERCLVMVRDENFEQDNLFAPVLQTPLVYIHTNPVDSTSSSSSLGSSSSSSSNLSFLGVDDETNDGDRGLFCAIKQDRLADGEPAVRLPSCGHSFSFEGIHGWITQNLQGVDTIACPLCQRAFVSKSLHNPPFVYDDENASNNNSNPNPLITGNL